MTTGLQLKMANNSRVLLATLVILAIVVMKTSADCVTVKSEIAHVGQPVTLPCPTVVDADVMWRYHDVRVGKITGIYSHGKILNGNVGRFELDSLVSNRRNLKLNVSRAGDAGLYSCIEENGLGDTHFVLLNVVGDETVEPDALDVTTSKEKPEVSEDSLCVVPPRDTFDRILYVLIGLVVITAIRFGYRVITAQRLKNGSRYKNELWASYLLQVTSQRDQDAKQSLQHGNSS